MDIYLCTDMEGASGVAHPDEFMQDRPRYDHGRRMLTGDVAAAVEGLKAGGADRIVVLDGHGGGNNLIIEDLPGGAEYIVGQGGGSRPLAFLDESFDAVGMIAQHAMAGTEGAVWPHTQNSASWLGMWINEREIGEIGQFSTVAGGRGVPLVLLTGDVAACNEASDLIGDQVETVAVKEAASPTRARCFALDDAHHLIFEGAKKCLTNVAGAKPLTFDTPMDIRVQFNATAHADGREAAGSERVDLLTVRRVTDDPDDVYRV
jgi:D-amino peptidase